MDNFLIKKYTKLPRVRITQQYTRIRNTPRLETHTILSFTF